MRQQRQTTNTEATVKLLLDENESLQFQLSSVSVDMDVLRRDQQPLVLPSETDHGHKTPEMLRGLMVSCTGLDTQNTPGIKGYRTPSTARTPQTLFVRAGSTPMLSPCYSSGREGSVTPQLQQQPRTRPSPKSIYGLEAMVERELEMKRRVDAMTTDMQRLKSENRVLKERLDRAWEFPSCFSFGGNED